MPGAGGGDRRQVDTAVAAGGDHHIVDTGQRLPGQSQILHEYAERADPGFLAAAGVQHRHGDHSVGLHQLGGAPGTGH